jgi:hypothetical protein
MNASERKDGRRLIAQIQSGDRLGSLATARALFHRQKPREDIGDQLAMWILEAFTVVQGCPLDCGITGLECVARQIKSEREVGKAPPKPRSSPAKRGRVSTFVVCRTDACAVGACMRNALGDVPQARRAAALAPSCSDLGERVLPPGGKQSP